MRGTMTMVVVLALVAAPVAAADVDAGDDAEDPAGCEVVSISVSLHPPRASVALHEECLK
jgi:hypothetical protein